VPHHLQKLRALPVPQLHRPARPSTHATSKLLRIRAKQKGSFCRSQTKRGAGSCEQEGDRPWRWHAAAYPSCDADSKPMPGISARPRTVSAEGHRNMRTDESGTPALPGLQEPTWPLFYLTLSSGFYMRNGTKQRAGCCSASTLPLCVGGGPDTLPRQRHPSLVPKQRAKGKAKGRMLLCGYPATLGGWGPWQSSTLTSPSLVPKQTAKGTKQRAAYCSGWVGALPLTCVRLYSVHALAISPEPYGTVPRPWPAENERRTEQPAGSVQPSICRGHRGRMPRMAQCN